MIVDWLRGIFLEFLLDQIDMDAGIALTVMLTWSTWTAGYFKLI